jgi:hypothetical protein
MDALAGVLGLLGAAMVLGGAAGAGALLGVWLARRRGRRGTRPLARYALAAGALLAAGAGLTRPEARGLVALFAVVPFLVGGLFAVLDLRRPRR